MLKFDLVNFVSFGYVLNEFPGCEYSVKEVRVLIKRQAKLEQAKAEQAKSEQAKSYNLNQRNQNFLKSR